MRFWELMQVYTHRPTEVEAALLGSTFVCLLCTLSVHCVQVLVGALDNIVIFLLYQMLLLPVHFGCLYYTCLQYGINYIMMELVCDLNYLSYLVLELHLISKQMMSMHYISGQKLR